MKPLDPHELPLRGVQLIEASAGTGKTYTIATLFMRLLIEERLDIASIVVVTFTTAATAELRARLRARLRATLAVLEGRRCSDDGARAFCELLSPEEQSDARELVKNALRRFDEARVHTIHGFCNRLLRERAFETQSPFERELVSDQRVLVEDLGRDLWVEWTEGLGKERYLTLCRDGFSPESVRAAVALTANNLRTELTASEAGPASEELLDLARQSADRLKERARRAGICTYDDLIRDVLDALTGPGGDELRARAREDFGAALIDEFQDTDPVQYDLFQKLFAHESGRLFLIGDPKQSIYAFRGADIAAYLEAARRAEGRHTLGVNWRSDPGLIKSVNTLFEKHREPFGVSSGDIGFLPVAARPGATDGLSGDGPTSAFRFLHLPAPLKADGRPGRLGYRERGLLPAALAEDVARTLTSGLLLEGEPVRPRDIAVLVPSRYVGADVQRELSARGVPAVMQRETSVFESTESTELLRILRAVIEPSRGDKVCDALATGLVGYDAAGIIEIREDDERFERMTARFERLLADFEVYGFMRMFRRLLSEFHVPQRLLGLASGERALTNLLHLADLVHEAGTTRRLAPRGLTQWLTAVVARGEAELTGASELRLESESDAVRVMTVHKSKGLEFPIVYVTSLHKALYDHSKVRDVRVRSSSGARAARDLRPSEERRRGQLEEELLEGLRVAYVALTRAKHQCNVVVGAFTTLDRSPLGYLLFGRDVTSGGAPRAGLLAETKATTTRYGPYERHVLEKVQALLEEMPFAELVTLEGEGTRYAATLDGPSVSGVRRFERPSVRATWSPSSFSAMARSESDEPHEDEKELDEAPAPRFEPDPAGGVHGFPAGREAGNFFHAVFEHAPFSADEATLRPVVERELSLHGFSASTWSDVAVHALLDVLKSPVPGAVPLAELDVPPWFKELDFTLRVGRGKRFGPSDLTRAFEAHGVGPSAAYAARASRLGFPAMSGYLRGSMDLVFQHNGRFYVADYKSNRLGDDIEAYATDSMQVSMVDHHYVLQYHLYAVALHRLLAQRLAGYDYDTHFGGVRYFYFRGMQGREDRGVFCDRPPRALIEALSTTLTGDA